MMRQRSLCGIVICAFVLLWTSAASAAIALDGSASGHSSAATQAVTLTTTQSSDLIVVDVLANGGPVTGITGGGLTFTQHVCNPGGCAAGHTTERWSAVAASPLSSVTLTITQTSSAFLAVSAYGISAANTGSPWDAGGPTTGAGDPLSITTVNANTMVICEFRMTSQGSPTAGTGFTTISADAGSFHLSEYQIESSANTYSCTIGTGVGDSSGSIADGVKQSSGAASPNAVLMPLMGVGQ